jgi:hypothetical protein
MGALQVELGRKEAELASLRASSVEQLAAAEKERVATTTRLSEASTWRRKCIFPLTPLLGRQLRSKPSWRHK